MDVHRSRFVAYPVSAISALAFSRTNDAGYAGPLPPLKLALGRANGDIEIWNPQRGHWVQETIFSGKNASIDGLAWTQEPNDKDEDGRTIPGQYRLFSIASSPSVTEWDLATGLPKRQSTGNFSEVWCLAAQPRSKTTNTNGESRTQDLIAGCGDGTIVLLSTADGDLQFKRFLARVAGKKARCLCITYQNRDRVVAGFADSMIRIYDTRNGNMLRSMSLGVSVPGAPKNALVWQVRCLQNGDLVSGDSNGEVKFWDAKTYSLLQRIQGHDSDCLDLIANHDGTKVMSGSIDGKVAIYRLVKGDQGRKSWAKSGHRRIHNGEVKAMACFDGKNMSVTVSGGSDATLMVTPLREYGKENVRSLPFLPQQPPVVSAPRARLMVSWWEKQISIWHMEKPQEDATVLEPRQARTLVAKINLDTKSSIQDVAISQDGRLLVASTNSEVKVFQLHQRTDKRAFKIRKLRVPQDMATTGARLVQVSPDGKWLLYITLDSEVYIGRVTTDRERPKHQQVLPRIVELERRLRTAEPTSFRHYDRTITRAAFSSNSSVVAVSDLAGYLDTWVLEGHEDITAAAIDTAQRDSEQGSSDAESDSGSDTSSDTSEDDTTTVFYGQHWTDNPSGHLLPKLKAPPLVLSFRPQLPSVANGHLVNGNPGIHSTRSNPHAHSYELPHGQHRLLVMTSKHELLEFDVLAGRLSDWGRKVSTMVLPDDFTKIRDRVMGTVWDVASSHRERLWLYGTSFVCMLDISEVLVDGEMPQQLSRKRRKRSEAEDDSDDDRKRRRMESGAGGKIDPALTNGGLMLNDLASQESDVKMESDEDSDLDPSELAAVNGHGETKRGYWCTFKYRPILGMVSLGDAGDAAEDRPLEVAIVERPLWDARPGSK